MTGADASSSASSRWSRLSGVLAPLSFLIILIVVMSVVAGPEGFRTRGNWNTIIQATAVVAILAVAETVVIIAGHIDLSVGRMLALSSVVAATVMVQHQGGILAGCGAALATGLVCGTVSGLLTAYGRMPAFIATLGMMGVAYGLALMVANDANISGMSPGFEQFALGHLGGADTLHGIPYPLLLMLAAAIGGHLLLARTGWGRHVYAVGGNPDAARLSGVSLRKITVTVFMLSGLLAGFAAIIHVARTGGGQPTAGVGLELQAIAATVIGGTSLSGGVGGIFGTLIGAFLMAVIQNGCDLKGIHPHFQVIIIGCVIWLAALYDGYRRKGGAR
jgi:ribose transport system permease protein